MIVRTIQASPSPATERAVYIPLPCKVSFIINNKKTMQTSKQHEMVVLVNFDLY